MPTADLTASVVADTAFAPLGGVVRYTATLRNSGTSPASDAAVEIRLPTGATYDAATPGCTGASVVTCAAGALGVGENRSFTIGASAAAPGAFDVSALAVSTTVDPQTANNRATVPVTVCTALGGTGRDRLVGTPGNDVLCGAGGNDTLHGQGGDDVLLGGPGNDKLDGGPGKDTATYAEATGKVKASLARGSATGDGKDRFKRVENLMGSRYADRLVGSGAGNVLSGLGGRDRIDARAGRDVIVAGDGDDRIAPGGGGDRVQGASGSTYSTTAHRRGA
jgi:uncharacterized repeat protein (TIGR01451 family)